MVIHYVILSIPVIIVTAIFGFLPWGLVTAIATPIVLPLLASAFPRRRYILVNVRLAREGLIYGCVNDAQEHIQIALREAEEARILDSSDSEELSVACDEIAEALRSTGQRDVAVSIIERCQAVIAKHSKSAVA